MATTTSPTTVIRVRAYCRRSRRETASVHDNVDRDFVLKVGVEQIALHGEVIMIRPSSEEAVRAQHGRRRKLPLVERFATVRSRQPLAINPRMGNLPIS